LLAGTGFVYVEKDHNYLNGVSTLDLVRMMQHIQGTILLDSPYKIIAADINRSGSVTMQDVVGLQKLLLGIHDRFPQNKSWRFISEEHVFPDPSNPFVGLPPDTLFRNFGATVGYAYSGIYIGIKVGDVNETANPLVTAPVSDVSADERMGLQTNDIWLPAGVEVIVPLKLVKANSLMGLQCALQFDKERVSVSGVLSEVLPGFTAGNIHFESDDLLKIVWYGHEPSVLTPENPLFLLKIKTLSPTWLSEVLWINEHALPSEAVFENLKTAALHWVFDSDKRWNERCMQR